MVTRKYRFKVSFGAFEVMANVLASSEEEAREKLLKSIKIEPQGDASAPDKIHQENFDIVKELFGTIGSAKK